MIAANNAEFQGGFNITKSRFIHVLYSGLGGHSAVLFGLLEGGFARSACHSVIFVGVEQPPADYRRRCENLNIAFDYLPKSAGKGNIEFLLRLCQKIARVEPDILFLHGLAAMPAVALLKLSRFGAKPYVLVRETQANHLKSRRDWISLVLAHQFADRIVHLTDEAVHGAEQKLKRFTKPQKVSVVPNGLDIDFYAPKRPSKDNGGVINIGMQSRLQPNKDHGTLIAAFSRICHRNPNHRFHLHIAGDGVTYGDIKHIIQQQGLNEITTLHGMLDKTQLRDFLQGLDIYVHCTHGETMSTAIMQAMSCGLPVIASNVAGVSNMVWAESEILYEPENPNDLSEKLEILIQDESQRKLWSDRARHYAVKNFGIQSTIAAYQKLIPSFLM